MIKVSIVVPMYNVEEYLEECLTSAIKQSLKDIEIVCVNDGSTDSTLSIARKFAANDKRVKVIDKENAGYGHTMNTGFANSTGEYIAILESDDYIDSKMCEELYDVAKKNNLDFIKADFNRFLVGEDGKLELNFERIAQKFDGYYNRVIKPSEEKIVFRFRMNTWSGIYNRSFIEKYGIDHNESPGASYQDNGFFFKTFCNAKRVMFKDSAYYMNRRDNINSSVHNKEKVYCMSDEYDYIKEYLLTNDLWDKFKDVYFLKRLHSEHFTYNRIGSEFKDEFLEFLSRNYKNTLNSGEKIEEYLSKGEFGLYSKIANDPEAFVNENKNINNRRNESRTKKVLRNLKNNGIKDTFFKIRDRNK